MADTECSTVKTTCPYCGVGCGISVSKDTEAGFKISGDMAHPANKGLLCSKGAALADTLGRKGRLLAPEINRKSVEWETALNKIATGFQEIIDIYGPDAVAFYVSGQLLTEDYYVANKLMKGFIGAANIDTNSRLCMSSSVAGHKRAFGSDTVPGCYEDLELADLVVLTGSNAAWCHPVLYQRLVAAKTTRPNMKVIVIDPRQTATSDCADLHLPIKPGTDAVLFNGLLTHLKKQQKFDDHFTNKFCDGLDATVATAEATAPNVEFVANVCCLDAKDVLEFYAYFEKTEKAMTLYSQGINQSSSGTDKVNSILNCHLVTGRIGRPGMGPFSLTGQPNAMGGREVGGLANQLAAHMEIDNSDHRELVQKFWQSPTIACKPGLAAVDLFDAVYAGDVKAIWIMGTNPAVSMPNNSRVRQALKKCKMVVVSDCEQNTDTADFADVLLPALAWGEKDGTVTNSERRISRQRPFVPAPRNAKPDWWIISEVAKRLGHVSAFKYQSSAEIFREHALLSGHQNNATRDFDISSLSTLTQSEYDDLAPIQWPVTDEQPKGTARLLGTGAFFTPGKKAVLVPVSPQPPEHLPTPEYPLILNTGRIRDQWHTMTRTGKSGILSAHRPEPYAEIHPIDAKLSKIRDRELITLETLWGKMVARATISPYQKQGSIFVPIHWNDQYASNGLVDALVSPATDPISKQPEFKYTPVAIRRFATTWKAFVLSRTHINFCDKANAATYWVSARANNSWRYEIAGEQHYDNKSELVRNLFPKSIFDNSWLEFEDVARGNYRGAQIVDDQLIKCIFISNLSDLPARDWLQTLFSEPAISSENRACLLSGLPPKNQKDTGPLICACFGVGAKTIIDAIENKQLATTDQIGEALFAGTNCGSCLPEITSILSNTASA
ncbi:molybdopterin-dependent oxidoreductase [Sneathiella marina]|uniref:Molybdopterin-dependent oxidoreductase n=1 Tax=Sneathiella marina TaxID=2950108 RepID=A0ABY4W7Y0_9PROT|nr:nitrate reductase [Sneathiella marina]USG62027.1 molybdopterin-dependent oxidoreductase [Sneathiella marina]